MPNRGDTNGDQLTLKMMPAIVVPVLVKPGALMPLPCRYALRLQRSKLKAPSGTVMLRKFTQVWQE